MSKTVGSAPRFYPLPSALYPRYSNCDQSMATERGPAW
jgi:hypothetical protein